MRVTPWTTTRWPGTVSSQLPPCSAARSTMTLPGFIERTMSAVISRRAGADDEHLRRRHLARGGDLAGEEATELVRGLDHGAVAGDVRHGGESIQLLGPRDTRHAVHGQYRRLASRELLHQLGVLRRP